MSADAINAPAEEIEPARLGKVVTAAAAGTVLEWYDFFIYGILATIVAKHFFTQLPDAQAFVFTLLTFAVGFIVRPIGALIFGKIGDSKGRKGAFLITIVMMGGATFAIGLLPDFNQIGILAPVLLITCRILQGLALGGEYGGAAIYVAEHSPANKRGFNTSWIQTSAALGLFSAILVILITRTILGEAIFADWGWRIPFLLSIALLGISLWIRLSLEESPAFKKMKSEGKTSEKVYAETFLHWPTLKTILIALFAVMMAQGVVWYTGHFYAQFFLERIAGAGGVTINIPGTDLNINAINVWMLTITVISAFLYVFFGWLSDKVGRKPIMMFGMAVMFLAYFPGFQMLTEAANPRLAAAQVSSPAVVIADPADCSFQLDLTGGANQFATSCDIAKGALANAGVSYTTEPGPAGAPAVITVGGQRIMAPTAVGKPLAEIRKTRSEFDKALRPVLRTAGYPDKANPAEINHALVIGVLTIFVIAATALYGPMAACLVELFPTRIRYTALSFPYHVGTGWFGGLMPTIAFSIATATGQVYAGLWFPFICTGIALVLALFLLPETKDRDIHA